MPRETNREIKALTSLRAIAAALVFFYHFVYLRHPNPAHNVWDSIIQNGFIGVTIFFVLSGFVLTLRYYREVDNHTFHWGTYIKRRVARIYPIYFVILAGIVLVGVPINITNVTLTQGFFTKLMQTGNIATWSLTVEECFYFMLPLVLYLLTRLKRLFLIAPTLLLWTLAMLAVGFWLMDWSQTTGIVNQAGFMGDRAYLLYRTVFGYIFDFSVGIFAAILYQRRGRARAGLALWLSMIGVGGIVGCQYLMSVFPAELPVRVFMYGVAVFTGVLIIALTCESTPLARLLAWSPFVYMGRISYAVYLLQLTPLVWFMSNWPVVWFYVGTNVLSALLYQLIEEPSHRLILGKRPVMPWLEAVLAYRPALPSLRASRYE